MQVALRFTPSALSLFTTPTNNTLAFPWKSTRPMHISPRCFPIRATTVAQDNSTVDYSSMASVFPAEACDTIGGEACDVEMYPEVKLKPEAQSSNPKTAAEHIDREYLEYDSTKTVFLGEACDDLGGEFCEPEYQTGVY